MAEENIAPTMEELRMLASGQYDLESGENDEQASGESDNGEASEESLLDQGADEDESEAEEDEPTQDEKPRVNKRSQRVKQLADEKAMLQRQLDQLAYELQKEREANKKILEMGLGTSTKAQAEDDEVLDEVLAKKMEEKFGKLEDQNFNTVKAQELGQIGGMQGEIYQKAVAAVAIEIMEDARSYGRAVNEYEAEQAAHQMIETHMRQMHKNGAQHGAIAHALARKAQYLDLMLNQKPSGQKAQNKVNMKKVEEARQTAGAPTTEKEAVNPGAGSDGFQQVLKERAAGLDPSYLAKFYGQR